MAPYFKSYNIKLLDCQPGDILCSRITDINGNILLKEGATLKGEHITKFPNWSYSEKIDDLTVYVKREVSQEYYRNMSGKLLKTISGTKLAEVLSVEQVKKNIIPILENILVDLIYEKNLDEFILENFINNKTDNPLFQHAINVMALSGIAEINYLFYEMEDIADHLERLKSLMAAALLSDLALSEITGKNGDFHNHGAEAIENYGHLLSAAETSIILDHHELPDGSGYPNGLTRASLSSESMLVSVCDAFDILMSQGEKCVRPEFDASNLDDNGLTVFQSLLEMAYLSTKMKFDHFSLMKLITIFDKDNYLKNPGLVKDFRNIPYMCPASQQTARMNLNTAKVHCMDINYPCDVCSRINSALSAPRDNFHAIVYRDGLAVETLTCLPLTRALRHVMQAYTNDFN